MQELLHMKVKVQGIVYTKLTPNHPDKFYYYPFSTSGFRNMSIDYIFSKSYGWFHRRIAGNEMMK